MFDETLDSPARFAPICPKFGKSGSSPTIWKVLFEKYDFTLCFPAYARISFVIYCVIGSTLPSSLIVPKDSYRVPFLPYPRPSTSSVVLFLREKLSPVIRLLLLDMVRGFPQVPDRVTPPDHTQSRAPYPRVRDSSPTSRVSHRIVNHKFVCFIASH